MSVAQVLPAEMQVGVSQIVFDGSFPLAEMFSSRFLPWEGLIIWKVVAHTTKTILHFIENVILIYNKDISKIINP